MTLPAALSIASRRVWPLALVAASLSAPSHAFDSGSTGADGALAPTVNTEIQLPPSGVLNYTSINIPQGVTVKFKRNTLNTPVYLLVSGNATVAGFLDLRGEDAKDSGTYGSGVLGDDGLPGAGGPGGYDGGRGGRDDASMRPEIIRGGAGLGPGGGLGGLEGEAECGKSDRGYQRWVGQGASHATHGGSNNNTACSTYYYGYPPFAFQPKPYGSALLQPLLGGSGGGGGRGGSNYPGAGGGGGGGALLLAASGTITIAASGVIDVTGGDGGAASGVGAGGLGGGGSAGAIRLVATTITGGGTLLANGGCIHDSNRRRQYCMDTGSFNNYGGAPGRIRLEAEAVTFNGLSGPAYSADQPGPVFLSSIPSLRIETVAGVAVPPVPNGTTDVALAADTPNPVTVTFKTTNVPTGNTVLLRVVPAYGNPIEALSPAISGTASEGQASVSVNLPQGPSVLQATTTYTVVVAMGEALSRFAGNERVEKVELIASLGATGEPQARLITVSGKVHTVPASVLAQVGVAG
ncbi:hypothetical protein ACT80S_14325 [Ramlibacter sp. MAHUQ-53]|uniref:hypothetical protein n=1 Tax=unclassified Ramlibacter TaxID=2617605 RepID=UPI0036378AC3